MKRLIVLVGTLLCLLAPMSAAMASADGFNPLSDACGSGGGVGGSSACTSDGSDPISGNKGILKKVSLILATIASITAVIIIIVSGIQLITSGGDSAKTARARNAVTDSAVGLVIIAVAEAIVLFVVNKLAKG